MKLFSPLLFSVICLFPMLGHGVSAAELVVIEKEESPQKDDSHASHDRFQRELGALLAQHMGLSVRFLDLPRKRFSGALESGDGDILCGYLPAWLPGPFEWSKPFIPNVQVVISVNTVAQPHKIEDMKGKRIGTVLGFTYPELEAALGSDFLRDDATSVEISLRKLAAGRFDYMVITMTSLHVHLKKGDITVALHPPLPISEISTQCAISHLAHVTVDEVDNAIDSAAKDGSLARLLSSQR